MPLSVLLLARIPERAFVVGCTGSLAPPLLTGIECVATRFGVHMDEEEKHS